MKTKRVLFLILAAIMLLSIASACGGGTSNKEGDSTPEATRTPKPETQAPVIVSTATPPPEAVYAEELVITIGQNRITVIDPGNTGSSAETTSWVLNSSHNTLTEVDWENPGEYIPSVAKSWETTDMQHFTFNLRDDVYFHNGEKLTADDVAFTIDRAKNSPGTHVYDKLAKIESYEVVDDYTIKVNYKDVNVDTIAEWAFPVTGILNRKALEEDPENGYLIGTGPYVIDEFVPSDYVTFVRNDDYWGELPKTKRLVFKYIAEQALRMPLLESHDCQVAFSAANADFPYMESNPDKFKIFTYIGNNTQYIAFNMNDPITGDINFRRAVAAAIDREEIIQLAMNGYGAIPDTGAYWGYKTQYKNYDIPLIEHDEEAAKAYLAQSSYNGETVTITTSIMVSAATVVQEQLARVGINCEIVQTDTAGVAAVASYSNNVSQMVMMPGGWQFEASSARNFFYPGASNNRASYFNQEVADLIDAAAKEIDEAKREQMYKRIQEITAEDLPFLVLVGPEHVIGALPNVDGVKLAVTSYHDLSYVYQVIG